jgi:phosphatidylglycerol:prolipoprotein diacylglycerol transferase
LAVNFPDGPRHDLGLYESLFSLLIFLFFAFLFKKLGKIRYGLVAAVSFAAYSFGRFFLDFLRAQDMPFADERYFYLTPAQWGMGLIFVGLTAWLISDKIAQRKI